MTPPRIGIDLGGTKIAIIAFDAQERLIHEARIPTPRNDYAASIRALRDLVLATEAAIGAVASVGIGMPGSISPNTGLVQNSNSVWLNGQPFHRDLITALERPLRFANDADCFALSEATDGAGAGAASVFGVIVGTGCGGGLVVDGQLLAGPNGASGEWGHMPLPWPTMEEYPGPQCWCGRHNCLETWLSGSGLERDHLVVTGERLSARDIAASAETGDPAAMATLERHLDRFARALGVLVSIIDPHVIVLGGGLSSMPHLYRRLPAMVAARAFADTARIDIRRPVHGDASGVRGAARLWDNGTP